METDTKLLRRGGDTKSQRGTEESPLVKGALITIALSFVVVFLLLPLINVFWQSLAGGVRLYWESFVDPDTRSAIKLTLLIAGIAVPLNLLFGLAAAWATAKFNFKGKPILISLIDLPFAVSPVVAGLLFVVLFGQQGFYGQWLADENKGFFGQWLADQNIKIIFAVPGMVLATVFITFPFVARELIPVMEATGTEQEQAALTLGASGWQTFWYVTLPSVRWGLLYGVILCNARAMGEFGAVSVVSGHITGQTDTMPLRVEKLYQSASAASMTAAFAVASLLALLALITLVIKTFLEWRTQREFALAQRSVPETSVLAPSIQVPSRQQ